MSGHWVFACPKGRYVGTRKNNGNMYESRPTLADSLADARVFNTKAAASNAGRAFGAKGDAVEVIISLSAPTASPAEAELGPGKPSKTQPFQERNPWAPLSAISVHPGICHVRPEVSADG